MGLLDIRRLPSTTSSTTELEPFVNPSPLLHHASHHRPQDVPPDPAHDAPGAQGGSGWPHCLPASPEAQADPSRAGAPCCCRWLCSRCCRLLECQEVHRRQEPASEPTGPLCARRSLEERTGTIGQYQSIIPFVKGEGPLYMSHDGGMENNTNPLYKTQT